MASSHLHKLFSSSPEIKMVNCWPSKQLFTIGEDLPDEKADKMMSIIVNVLRVSGQMSQWTCNAIFNIEIFLVFLLNQFK